MNALPQTSAPSRPLWQFHLGTLVLAMLVISAALAANLALRPMPATALEPSVGFNEKELKIIYGHGGVVGTGWPNAYYIESRMRTDKHPTYAGYTSDWAANLFVCTGLIAASTVVCESLLRRTAAQTLTAPESSSSVQTYP